MEQDQLLILLKNALNDESNPHEDGGELVHRVVETYLKILMDSGFVPGFAVHEVIEDIEIEAVNIYRKLTYGHFNLKEFRLKRRET